MTLSGWLGAGLAVAASLAGILCLYKAMQRSRPHRRLYVLAGWLLLAAAAAGWLPQSDWDRAMALGLLVPSVLALPVLAWVLELRKPGRARRSPDGDALEPPAGRGRGRVVRGTVRTVVTLLPAGVLALALGALFAIHGPGAAADRLIGAAFLAPLLWAGLAIWSLSDPRLLRASAAITLLAALPVALLWALR